MNTKRDIIIIGAGPAGLSAAITASYYGLDVLVLDEQPSLGGQIYRNIEKADKQTLNILGLDYAKGISLVKKFRKSKADYIGNAIVWRIDPNGNICFSVDSKSTEINSKYVIIAIGAMERPVPFPGWTLPGVMGIGAVDANFKSSGIIPKGPVVIAGNGPLLLAATGLMARLGVDICAVLETTPFSNIFSAFPYLPKALRRTDYLLKGMRMLLDLNRSGINYIRGVNEYRANGNDTLKSISFQTKKNVKHIDAKILLVHEGIIPRCDFTNQINLKHRWEKTQRYWYPETDIFGRTKLDTIYVAGDGAFVHGGISAALKGSLASLDIANKLLAISPHKKRTTVTKLKKNLFSELSPRPFIDTLYKPNPNLYKMKNHTLICRCEEVTAKDIQQVVLEGCKDPNEIKTITRCGMGQCQGRMCGSALNEIVAKNLDLEPYNLRPLNIRPPVRNISLSELSKIDLIKSRSRVAVK